VGLRRGADGFASVDGWAAFDALSDEQLVLDLVELRKQHPVFGLGTYEPLEPSNPRIFAHVRRWEEEIVLCVHNLARTAQAAELDLAEFDGLVPEEMFGQTRFPPIGELPYLLTFGARGFYWFRLAEEAAA